MQIKLQKYGFLIHSNVNMTIFKLKKQTLLNFTVICLLKAHPMVWGTKIGINSLIIDQF